MEDKLTEIKVTSTIDGSEEPSLLFRSRGGQAPLIVSLHSWSAGRHNGIEAVMQLAEESGSNAVFPEFRGPNLASNPRAADACASGLAIQDIVDAAEELIQRGTADPSEIFLIGGSGGAHMSLMTAAHRPELWKAVIASCPITDLAAWHGQNKSYAPHIEACCGGPPDSPGKIAEYKKRSPICHAGGIAGARVYILHGKNDPSVPFTHSLNLFNKICADHPGAEVYLEIFRGGHEQKQGRTAEIINTLSRPDSGLSKISG